MGPVSCAARRSRRSKSHTAIESRLDSRRSLSAALYGSAATSVDPSFSANGTFDRTIGRRGAGPGELSNAEGIVFASDGALWVRDAANARYSRFDADGTALDTWTMNYCSSQGT